MADDVRFLYPAYKVYIFGVDVTDDVLSVTTSDHDGASPGTCQISLNNEFDKYIATQEDIIVVNNLNATTPGGKFVPNLPWLQPLSTQPSWDRDYSTTWAALGASVPQSKDDLANSIEKNILNERKREIMIRKIRAEAEFSSEEADETEGPGRIIGKQKYNDYFGAAVKHYPFACGFPIFHQMDQIRVFMRDPQDPSRWFHMFAGFLSDTDDTRDANNQRILTIAGEDVTKLLRYTRISINPGYLDADKQVQKEDLKQVSVYASIFRGLSLPEIFFTAIFGPERAGSKQFKKIAQEGQANTNRVSTFLRSIGHFAYDMSAIFEFGPTLEIDADDTSSRDGQATNSGSAGDKDAADEEKTTLLSDKPPIYLDSLAKYHAILDHEVKISDLWTMATQEDRSNDTLMKERLKSANIKVGSDGSFNAEDIVMYIGMNPQTYLVDGGRLLVLIPRSLGSDNRNIVVKDIVANAFPANSDFVSMGSVLYDTVERIQYSMHATPRGDIVVEPPLYDFNPDAFGLDPIKLDDLNAHYPLSVVEDGAGGGKDLGELFSTYYAELLGEGGTSQTADGTVSHGGMRVGPYAPLFTIFEGDTYDIGANSTDEKMYSICSTSRAIVHNYESLGFASDLGQPQVRRLKGLIPLIGVRAAPVTSRGFIATDEAAKYYADITLAKLNADARTITISAAPNLHAWVNRPMFIQAKFCIATARRVAHTISWNSAMSTTVDFSTVRTWEGSVQQDDNTVPVFTSIGGHASEPLNYAVLMGMAPPVEPLPDEAAADQNAPVTSQSTTDGARVVDNAGQKIVLKYIGNGRYLEESVATAFLDMRKAADGAGVTLTVNSAYRDINHQQALYDKYKADTTGTVAIAAEPKKSKHTKGKAVDIATGATWATGSGWGSSTVLDWLKNNAHTYGFKNPFNLKTDTKSEPWHWEHD
jgi:D-alanyl-D-alanine carboxypeptidase